MAKSAVSLPCELINQILQESYFGHRLRPDHNTLAACSLVCWSWREPAQRLLFHEVTLPGRSMPQLVDSIRVSIYGSSAHSHFLASCVRRIHLIVDGVEGRQHCGVSDLIELLSHCLHVYEVSIRVQAPHALDTPTTDALRTLHQRSLPTPIRALTIQSSGTLSPMLYQLLSVWPTIQHLRLDSELAALPPVMPTNVRLCELILWRMPRPRIVGWLISGSADTLRILECHTAPDSQYDHVLGDFYGRLQSLRIWRHTLPSNSLIRKCAALQELVIAQPSSFLPLGDLPASLEHLGFRHFSGTDVFSLKPIISAVDKLPNLRLVTCDGSAGEHDEFTSLENACEKRNVEICFNVLPIPWTVSMRSFCPLIIAAEIESLFVRLLQQEDPVPIVRYPRSRTVKNFGYMNQPILLASAAHLAA